MKQQQQQQTKWTKILVEGKMIGKLCYAENTHCTQTDTFEFDLTPNKNARITDNAKANSSQLGLDAAHVLATALFTLQSIHKWMCTISLYFPFHHDIRCWACCDPQHYACLVVDLFQSACRNWCCIEAYRVSSTYSCKMYQNLENCAILFASPSPKIDVVLENTQRRANWLLNTTNSWKWFYFLY